jgi:hypothetical protein
VSEDATRALRAFSRGSATVQAQRPVATEVAVGGSEFLLVLPATPSFFPLPPPLGRVEVVLFSFVFWVELVGVVLRRALSLTCSSKSIHTYIYIYIYIYPSPSLSHTRACVRGVADDGRRTTKNEEGKRLSQISSWPL